MRDSSKILYVILSGILSLVLLASVVLMAIPSTRTKIADKVATNLSPAYAEIKDENSKQAEEIKSLNGQIKGLNDDITAKNLAIDEKNKLIAEKDSKIASQQEQLATCTANINTLTTQRTSLLASVTEIDNKINSTTDSVELENLEARKTAIISQIDTLNTQITTLTQEKTQLEVDIASLRQEKATLQSQVSQLENDKASLQSQVNSLLSQLEQYSQITVSIDATYEIASITISDTKMGAIYSLNDAVSTVLDLATYQTATITYANAELKATINGVQQENNVAVIEPAGQDVSVGAVDPTVPVTLAPGLYEHDTTNLIKSWEQLITDGDITITTTDTSKTLECTNKELAGDLVCGSVDGLTSLTSCFNKCSKLKAIDVTNLNTSEVVDMSHLFDLCSGLLRLNLNSFNTSNVTNMAGMFWSCTSLLSVDLSSFDTSNVTDMNHMFYLCQSLKSLDVSNFDTSKVTNMSYMFNSVQALTELDISNFDTSKVTDFSRLFYRSYQLKKLNLGSFEIGNSSNLDRVFTGMSALTSITYSGTIEQWTAKNLTNARCALKVGTTINCADGDYTSI